MKNNSNPSKVQQALIEAIAHKGGAISFAQFMEIALYSEEGYYNTERPKIGKEGDYITAPELSPLFAECMARQCCEILHRLPGEAALLEIGGGLGTLARDILKTLESLHTLPTVYYLLETSKNLKKCQQQLIQSSLPSLFERCVWVDSLPLDFKGIVIANEWLDALPVHRFRITEKGIASCCVTRDALHSLAWIETAPIPEEIKILGEKLQNTYHLPLGYTSEINLSSRDWVNALAKTMKQGVILFIDYGYPGHEYYHGERREGTLTCFYQHCCHSNPFFLPGMQDITAHVDFTFLSECAVKAGLEASGFTTQALFLLGCEIAAERGLSKTQHSLFTQQVERLTHPSEMGEIYKVLALAKNYPHPLIGFSFRDMRHKL
ncbi:MAG: SAM-dependent methyltransferase [Gammaproteobacteria bacterium]|nr:SAM-dependent methyltransferase [Gammaproteobacteria bacterium]